VGDDKSTVRERGDRTSVGEPARGAALARYVLGDEIARGGMGRVAEAHDRVLDRYVAVKQALDADPDALERFARETAITARLEHPSIVPLYDAGRDEHGNPFYVMRRVDGRRLSDLVAEASGLDARLALVPHVLAAAEATGHAHRRGIIHRDLKPENILVGDLGETVVIDWGLAKVIDDADIDGSGPVRGSLTSAGAGMGTPGYMSPEQLAGAAATKRSDVYALGATLHHVLVGPAPPIATARRVPGVPRDLVTIAESAMADDPTHRFADAAELATELRRFLTGQLVAAHRYSVRERIERFVRRHRVAVAVALASVLAIAIIATVSIRRVVRARDEAMDQRRDAERARHAEATRADELLVERARLLAPENPIAAITQLHELRPGSPMWRRARNVAARAQTFGLPWVLPAGKLPTSIAITRDAKRAYSAAGDIWVHDVEHRTSTKLVAGDATSVALAEDDRTLVYAGKTSLVTRELASGHEQRWARVNVTALVAAGPSIVWLDANGAFVLRNGAPLPLPPSEGTRLALAPDGMSVAVFGARGATIIALDAQPAIVFRHSGDTWDVRWSADGAQIAIADQRGGFVVHRAQLRDAAEQQIVPYTTRAALFAAGTPVFAGTDNVVYREGVLAASAGSGTFHLTHAALLDHGAVFDTAKRELVVTGPVTDRIIRLPGTPTALAAAGAHVVVAVPSHVLIYDLSTVLPRIVTTPRSRFGYHELLDERSLVSAQLVGDLVDWRIYDLDGGAPRTFGSTGLARPVALAPDGSYFACAQVSPAEIVILRAGKPAIHTPAATQNVRAASAALAVLVETNAIRTLAIADGRITPVLETSSEIMAVAASETFVVISLPDRLVSIELATGARREVMTTAKAATITVDRSGLVHFAAGQDVMRWDGERLALLAHLPAAISGFSAIPNRIVVLDEHASAWTIDATGAARRLLPPRTDVAAWSVDGTRAVARSLDGDVSYFDLEARDTWQLPVSAPQVLMSPSGRRLVAVFEGGVGVYDLALPEDAAGYARWLDTTTNLRTNEVGDTVWPD
jgi:predicted Ser/Thr protein kinase